MLITLISECACSEAYKVIDNRPQMNMTIEWTECGLE